METVKAVAGSIAQGVPLLWFALAVVIMIVYRKKLGRLAEALVKRVESGAGFKAFGAEVAPLPAADTTVPRVSGEGAEGVTAEGEDEDRACPQRPHLGMFASHGGHRSSIVVGGGRFVRTAYNNAFLTMWDAQAMAQVNTVLAGSAGGETEVALLSDEPAAWAHLNTHDSIIAIGGPLANPISRIAIPRLVPTARFVEGSLRVSPDVPTFRSQREATDAYADGTRLDHVLVVSGVLPETRTRLTVIAARARARRAPCRQCALSRGPRVPLSASRLGNPRIRGCGPG